MCRSASPIAIPLSNNFTIRPVHHLKQPPEVTIFAASATGTIKPRQAHWQREAHARSQPPERAELEEGTSAMTVYGKKTSRSKIPNLNGHYGGRFMTACI